MAMQYEPGHKKNFLGISTTTRMRNLASGGSTGFLRYLEFEQEEAQDSGHAVSAWLNRLEFKPVDFVPLTFKPDPQRESNIEKSLLAAGIIYYGLKLGYSFNFLHSNISELSASLCSKPKGTLDIKILKDPEYLTRARGTVLFARLSADCINDAIKLTTDVICKTPAGDALLDVACYSALLSFLSGDRKLVLSADQLERIRAGESAERILEEVLGPTRPAPDFSQAVIPALELFSAIAPLEIEQKEQLLPLCKKIAGEVDQFVDSLVCRAELQYYRDALPTEADKKIAVELMLAPGRLKDLYDTAINYLSDQLERRSPHGFPDHDRRHILFSVPVTALQLSEGQPQYQQIFGFYCCLLHDAGRIIENHFDFNDPTKKELSKIHPQVSAAVCAQLLEQFSDLPSSVRNEILVAVAMHDSGQVTNSELSIFVQSVDRLQLIGPEYLIRTIGYLAACKNVPFYTEKNSVPKSGESVFGALSYFLHNLYPNIAGGTDLESRLSICSGAILKLATYYGADSVGELFAHAKVYPEFEWPDLPTNLVRAIDREAFIAISGNSRIFPSICSTSLRSERLDSLGSIERLLALPLISQLDFDVSGLAAKQNLSERVLEAERLGVGLNIAMRYAMLCAEAYNAEMLFTVESLSQQATSPVQSVMAQAIKGILPKNVGLI